MDRKFTDEDDALLAELGVVVEPEKAASRTPREERIIAGFEEIQRFVEMHGRAPRHGEDGDIFERLYAVRLDRIREQDDCRALLTSLDNKGLLNHQPEAEPASPDAMDDDALLAELGVEASAPDITELRHVRSSAEKRAIEEIATRSKCEDFENFRPLFEQVQNELDAGLRETRPLGIQSDIEPGRFFIVGGQKAYVAEIGEEFTQSYGDRDARLRVIFDNGTESNMLRRSLQRALHKDEKGRRILETTAGPLFAKATDDDDEASGTIYVLRSKADIPFVAENRDLVHKIGVTTSKVESRIAGARLDPTFLMAEVEVVATYSLYNIDRAKLEKLVHRIFAPARLDIEIEDRFGNPVVPREWFLAPLHAIDEAVEKIREGTITQFQYNATSASLVSRQKSPARL
ncbi:MAG: GIY-YIG nuclease family protein [Rhodospirillaceae bacterium]|nr:GIY-YIG nuclease family protein [Rhodospirillaceae bacterium]